MLLKQATASAALAFAPAPALASCESQTGAVEMSWSSSAGVRPAMLGRSSESREMPSAASVPALERRSRAGAEFQNHPNGGLAGRWPEDASRHRKHRKPARMERYAHQAVAGQQRSGRIFPNVNRGTLALLHAPFPSYRIRQLSRKVSVGQLHMRLQGGTSTGGIEDLVWNQNAWQILTSISTGGITGPAERRGLRKQRHMDQLWGTRCQGEGPASGSDSCHGEKGWWSVIIPTYNRLPILTKCLEAMEAQAGWREAGIEGYEVVVVDDGSSDATVAFLRDPHPAEVEEGKGGRFPRVRLLTQHHAGATVARNLGVASARGETIVFIDSDLVVVPGFLRAHAESLAAARARDGDDRAFTYGRVVNTSNFDEPSSEPFKLTDSSAAFFATGNVAISRRRLLAASQLLPPGTQGPFDADFSEYGWEDLELGERLRQGGARLVHCSQAVGFHWHPAFDTWQIPHLIEQERQRGRNGVRFFQKHPTLNVRLMVQMTPVHEALWFVLTLGGLVNEVSLRPLLDFLVNRGQNGLAAALMSPTLNWHTVQAVKAEFRKLRAANRGAT